MLLKCSNFKLLPQLIELLFDRISGAFEMPGMAELIAQRAQQLNLGTSWNPP